MIRRRVSRASALAPIALVACGMSPVNPGVPGSPAVGHPNVPGTIFTIMFENDDLQETVAPENPTFYRLSQQYGSAQACISDTHPSLPNYLELTSGTPCGAASDNDPAWNVSVDGTTNLPDQLDAAGIPWRAYMESMGTPCKMATDGVYTAHHNPFIYYHDMATNQARCNERVVDFAQNFAADLASNQYRYMWITPNDCNDMHNCPNSTADTWLNVVVQQIQASPGYLNGGAIFILVDEGELRFLSAAADVAAIVVSPNLVSASYSTQTHFDHASYVATVEDILGLPRLPATTEATPMDEFFAAVTR